MKILYCVGSLDKPGGTEKVLSNKCNYFVNNLGFEVHIITVNQANKEYCYEWDEKIHFYDIEYNSVSNKLLSFLTIPNKIAWFRKVYTKLINEIKPDIIIVTERGYLDYVIPFICKNIPKVREFHSSHKAIQVHAGQMNLINKYKHKAMYSVIYKMFNFYDYLILLTDKDFSESSYKTKVRVIPNMVDQTKYGQAGLVNLSAISVGSMNGKIKDFDNQIKIWKEVVKDFPLWVLNIYGDGARRGILQEQIKQYQLEDNVILHGNSNKLHKKYLESSMFLFTSVGEGFPMVLIEAMSSGLPIVSFNCPHGPSEIIRNGEDGFIINEGDNEEFIRKTKLLMSNIELRKELGSNAKRNVKRYSPSNIAKIWENLFHEIIMGK